MLKFLELQAFYEKINQDLEPNQSELGHFNIFKVEDLLLAEHKPAYSRRSFYKISLVIGHSKIHYADQGIEVEGAVLVFTNPMIPYFWERISEKQSGYVCIFTEAFFNGFGNIREYPVFRNTDSAVVPLTEQDSGAYHDRFLRMYDELQGDYAYKYDLLRTLLMEVIHGAQKMKPAPGKAYTGSNASERISALFSELLERQFPTEAEHQTLLRTPSAFARQLNIHVNHLNKALKETTGQSTSQLINDRLAQEARVLLRATNRTVNEIAWALGFDEPNHFSTFFKRLTGTSPNKFRQADAD